MDCLCYCCWLLCFFLNSLTRFLSLHGRNMLTWCTRHQLLGGLLSVDGHVFDLLRRQLLFMPQLHLLHLALHGPNHLHQILLVSWFFWCNVAHVFHGHHMVIVCWILRSHDGCQNISDVGVKVNGPISYELQRSLNFRLHATIHPLCLSIPMWC